MDFLEEKLNLFKKLLKEEDEEEKGRAIEGNVQSLSKSTLEQVSKYIANSINQKMPDEDDVTNKQKSQPLGIIDFKNLRKLSTVPIKGLKVSPAQVKGEQQAGLSQIDFKKYEEQQIVPLFLTNNDLENIGGKSSNEEFAAIFYLPAMFCEIEDKNIPIHSQMFGLPKPEKGKTYFHVGVNSLKYELVNKSEIAAVQKSFVSGNMNAIKQIERIQSRRRPSGSNEKAGESQVAKKNEETNESLFVRKSIIKDKNKRAIYNMQKLHKNKLSHLLFESDLNELHSQDLKEDFVYKKGVASLLNELKELNNKNYDNVFRTLKDEPDIFLRISGGRNRIKNYAKIINTNPVKPYILLFNNNSLQVFNNSDSFESVFKTIDIDSIKTFKKTDSEMNNFLKVLTTKLELGQISFNGNRLKDEDKKEEIKEIIKKSLGIVENPEESQPGGTGDESSDETPAPAEGSSESGIESAHESLNDEQKQIINAQVTVNKLGQAGEILLRGGFEELASRLIKTIKEGLETNSKDDLCMWWINHDLAGVAGNHPVFYFRGDFYKIVIEKDQAKNIKFIEENELQNYFKIILSDMKGNEFRSLITFDNAFDVLFKTAFAEASKSRGLDPLELSIQAKFDETFNTGQSTSSSEESAEDESPVVDQEVEGEEEGYEDQDSQEKLEENAIDLVWQDFFGKENIIKTSDENNVVFYNVLNSKLYFLFYNEKYYSIKIDDGFDNIEGPLSEQGVENHVKNKLSTIDLGGESNPSALNNVLSKEIGFQSLDDICRQFNINEDDFKAKFKEKFDEEEQKDQDSGETDQEVEPENPVETPKKQKPAKEEDSNKNPNLRKYFGKSEKSNEFNALVQSVKNYYANSTSKDIQSINLENDSIDEKIKKDFKRKVLSFIAKNEKLIFNKWKKIGEDSLTPGSTEGSYDLVTDIYRNSNLEKIFIEKLSQLMLYYFVKKQSMFENKYIANAGLSLLLESNDENENVHKDLLFDLINKEKNIDALTQNLIIGLINHAVNDDIIDTEWKLEPDRAGKIMSTKVLAKRIKKANPGITDSNEISEDMIRSLLVKDLKNICLGILEKYDPNRYETLLNQADTALLDEEKEKVEDEKPVQALEDTAKGVIVGGAATPLIIGGIAAGAAMLTGGASILPTALFGIKTSAIAAGTGVTVGGVVGYFRSRSRKSLSRQDLADRFVKESGGINGVITARENKIFELLKNEIDELVDLIFVLVKEDKDIFEESKDLFIGRLSKFLFEANEKGEEISVQDIKDYLKSSAILIYSNKSKLTGKNLQLAEKELIGSIAAIFKSHFGVNVKGAAGYKKLDTRKVEVASIVNQNAEKGQPASEKISNMTAGAGIPTGMNAPFDMNQMAAMVNMMGGNPMMMFMMMMMNPQFMQQMMKMQKKGVTFGEASKVVAEKTEISGFDRLLEDIIENQRANLPNISRKDAIKVIKLCKNIYEAFNDIDTNLVDVKLDHQKKKAILFKMESTFNIVKEDQNQDDKYAENAYYFILNEFLNVKLKSNMSSFIKNHEMINSISNITDEQKDMIIRAIQSCIINYIVYKFVESLFGVEFLSSEERSLTNNINNIKSYINSLFEEAENITVDDDELKDCLTKLQINFIDNKINFEGASKITAENKLMRNKSIIRSRPIRKNKIINESEFLKKELKRLWKL